MARALRGVVLDAGPVVDLLLDEPSAIEIADALRGAGSLRISVVNVAEVIDVTRRVHGASAESAAAAVDRFLDEVARPVPVTRELAERAADIRARHYHRQNSDVSLADCFVIATAEPGDTVATSDSSIVIVARAEGLAVLALPNARGRRP